MGLISSIQKKWHQRKLNKIITADSIDKTKLQACIALGADVSNRNENTTPLYEAAVRLDCKAINLLLDAKADPSITGAYGHLPIEAFLMRLPTHILYETDNVSAQELHDTAIRLLENTDINQLNRLKVYGEYVLPIDFLVNAPEVFASLVPILKEKGFDFNLKDMNNHSLLFNIMAKTVNKDTVILQPLLGERCSAYDTPSDKTRKTVGKKLVTELINAGAQLDKTERFPVMSGVFDYASAYFRDDPQFINRLCDTIPADYTDENGNTLLHLYAQTYDFYIRKKETDQECAQAIFNHLIQTYDINARNKNGQTPLMCAVQDSFAKHSIGDLPWMEPIATVEFRDFQINQFLATGADLTVKDITGKDVFDYAVQAKHTDLTGKLLKECKALCTPEHIGQYMDSRSEKAARTENDAPTQPTRLGQNQFIKQDRHSHDRSRAE